MARLDYVEVWNSNDSAQTFHVALFDAEGEQLFEQTATVAGATGTHYTRKVLSEAPESAAAVRASVDGETTEKRLGTHDEPVLLSVKYNDEGQLRIAGFA